MSILHQTGRNKMEAHNTECFSSSQSVVPATVSITHRTANSTYWLELSLRRSIRQNARRLASNFECAHSFHATNSGLFST